MVPEIVARSNVIITCHHIISRHAKYNTKYNMEYLFFFLTVYKDGLANAMQIPYLFLDMMSGNFV